jgi:small subunit ribosomal protein S4
MSGATPPNQPPRVAVVACAVFELEVQHFANRLDNIVTVSGLAASRTQARQLVNHGHIEVNGKKVRTPSYLIKEGDVIRPRPVDSILDLTRTNREDMGHPEPAWLSVNDADLTVQMARMPVREDVSLDVDEGLVVEFCSR